MRTDLVAPPRLQRTCEIDRSAALPTTAVQIIKQACLDQDFLESVPIPLRPHKVRAFRFSQSSGAHALAPAARCKAPQLSIFASINSSCCRARIALALAFRGRQAIVPVSRDRAFLPKFGLASAGFNPTYLISLFGIPRCVRWKRSGHLAIQVFGLDPAIHPPAKKMDPGPRPRVMNTVRS